MITRKDFIKGTVLLGTAMMTGLQSTMLRAQEKKVDAGQEFEKAFGKKMADVKADAKVSLQVPTIAESGANVPVKLTVNMPLEKVKSAHIFIDNNPVPHILGMTFSPLNGQAYVEARVRFAKSSTIRGVAILADGSAIMAKQDVKVTVGGCG
jgi:sulfur-oxidizing protein SoxY